MYASAVPRIAVARSRSANATALAELSVGQLGRGVRGLVMPRPEVHLAVRFGSPAGLLDVHALGGLQRVRRKLLGSEQRVVMARLQLGGAEAVLGVPDAAIAGRIVALEELWGNTATQRLLDQLAEARDTVAAAAILERSIAERCAVAPGHRESTRLVLDAADRLASESVNAVAVALGVSDRHLRRVFRETIGVSPKAFAKVTRFRRAVRAARAGGHASWAAIAAETGYYDQAHLISEFRAIAGVTPRALLAELRAAQSLG